MNNELLKTNPIKANPAERIVNWLIWERNSQILRRTSFRGQRTEVYPPEAGQKTEDGRQKLQLWRTTV